MIKAIVFLSLLGVAMCASKCETVTCTDPGDGNCAAYTSADKTWKIKSCPSNERCNTTLAASGTATAKCVAYAAPPAVDPPAPVKKIAGTFCTAKTGCFSDKCTGSVCEGIKTGACVSTTSTTDKEKVCGGEMYCKADNTCAKGVAKDGDCSATLPCAHPNVCFETKCVAPASIKVGDACPSNVLCAEGNYCKAAVCADMGAEYTSGKFGALCTANTGCAPADCNCSGTANTKGEGRCGGVGDGYTSKVYDDAVKTHALTQKYEKCPIKNTSGCTTFLKFDVPKFTYGGCYSTFRHGLTDAATSPGLSTGTAGGDSAANIVASLIAFLAYFLF